MYVKTLGFAPDLPPETAGVMTDCDGFIPTVRGMEAVSSGEDASLGTLSSTAIGLATIRRLDGTRLTFAGTTTDLYHGTSTWNKVTRSSGEYSVPSNEYWTFAQYGNVTLASNGADPIQVMNSGDSVFSDLTASVVAKIVLVVNDFIFAFNTNESTYGESQDRWWCSALGDHTNFTPSIQVQCATNRLTDTFGGIEAAARFGDDVIVYKPHSMYIGRYIGAPFIWDFRVISDEVGAIGVNSVVTIGDPVPLQFFVGYDDFYIYDGSRPRVIGHTEQGSIISDHFFNDLNNTHRNKIIGTHDSKNSRVFWFYPNNSSSGTPNKFVCYNYRSKQWGKGSLDVTAATTYFGSGTTYNDLGTLFSTYHDLPDLPYSTAFLGTTTPVSAFFKPNKTFYQLTGTPSTNSYVTNNFGEDNKMTVINRMRPRFTTNPTTGTQKTMYRDSLGDSDVTLSSTANLTDNCFDVVNEARWQSFKHEYTGSIELNGIDVEGQSGGLE